MATDATVYATIQNLVDEEHSLRAERVVRSGDSAPQAERLKQLEAELDQCWDLLRQRRALRASGADPEAASARPIKVVEHYLQ